MCWKVDIYCDKNYELDLKKRAIVIIRTNVEEKNYAQKCIWTIKAELWKSGARNILT